MSTELALVYEIVKIEFGAKMVIQTADGPFSMETTYTWSEIKPGLKNETPKPW